KEQHAELLVEGWCVNLAFSKDGGRLLTSAIGEKGCFALWQLPEGKLLLANHHQAGNDWDGNSGAAAPDFSVAAATGSKLRLFDLTSGTERWSAEGRNMFFGRAAFRPDAKILATAEGRVDSAIDFWDVASGKGLGPHLTDHRVAVSGLVFFPDGQTLASSGL